MHLLQANNLVKRYGPRTVVDQVSYAVNQAEIVGLLGRNGAGKTTSFRMTIGMITPNGGQVLLNGKDITRMPMYRRANLGMGYLSQEPSILRRATVEQNLMAFLELEALTRRERKARLEALLEQFDLAKTRRQLSSTLSGGERRKLEIARCLIKDPVLILLDEPFSGVDPLAVEELQHEILRLREERGIAMLITDHNVQQTLRVCDRAYIVNEGRVLRDGTPAQLVRDPIVRQSYLGSMFRGDEFDVPLAAPIGGAAHDDQPPAPSVLNGRQARRTAAPATRPAAPAVLADVLMPEEDDREYRITEEDRGATPPPAVRRRAQPPSGGRPAVPPSPPGDDE